MEKTSFTIIECPSCGKLRVCQVNRISTFVFKCFDCGRTSKLKKKKASVSLKVLGSFSEERKATLYLKWLKKKRRVKQKDWTNYEIGKCVICGKELFSSDEWQDLKKPYCFDCTEELNRIKNNYRGGKMKETDYETIKEEETEDYRCPYDKDEKVRVNKSYCDSFALGIGCREKKWCDVYQTNK